MRVLYAGFNMYGQIIYEPKDIVKSFKEFHYHDINNIELSYSYSIIKNSRNEYLFHFKNNESTKPLNFLIGKNIIQTSCCHKWCLFLQDSGDILKYEIKTPENIVTLPSVLSIDSDSTDQIIKIASGSHITVAVTRKGKVFNFPNLLNTQLNNIKDVAVGNEHCLILDSLGNVLSFGRGSRGQLGHGNLNDEAEPKLVEALAGIKIVAIAAGGWHSCAVSAEGDLYTWGWNGNGQLGLNSEDTISVMASPQAIDFPEPETNVVQVACGKRHTVALLDDNCIYGCGWNKYSQLGISSNGENVYTMTKLTDCVGKCKKIELKCGPWSTAVCIN